MKKPIKNYEGLYSVTKNGRVWSNRSKKYLIPINNVNGYLTVNLYDEKGCSKFYIHRLVAQAYIPNPNDLSQVNHKDCDKKNNTIHNLEWMSPLDNIRHAIENGKIDVNGEKSPLSKLKEKQVKCIRYLYSKGNHTQQSLADYYDVSQVQICKIINFKSWK